MNLLFAFQFHNDTILHKQVRAEPTVQLNLLVNEGHRFLSDDPESLQIELIRKAAFVGRLQQTRTEATMNLDRRSDDSPGELKHGKVLNAFAIVFVCKRRVVSRTRRQTHALKTRFRMRKEPVTAVTSQMLGRAVREHYRRPLCSLCGLSLRPLRFKILLRTANSATPATPRSRASHTTQETSRLPQS